MDSENCENVINVKFKSDKTVEIETSRGKQVRPMDSDAVKERRDKQLKQKQERKLAYSVYPGSDDYDSSDWPPLA
jgi:hypothetical protein